MATAAAERVRCVCGQFSRRRPDTDSYSDTEREYVDEYQDDHDCSMGLYGPERRVSLDMMPVVREQPMDVLELDLVGPQEIANLLGVKLGTVWQWRVRKLLPACQVISGVPIWTWETIERWAIQTGRLKDNKGEQA